MKHTRSSTCERDPLIADLLEAEGFADAAVRARCVLEEARITNARKLRISGEKVEFASALLRKSLARRCEACSRTQPEIGSCREVVIVRQTDCEGCDGSNNRRAGQKAVRALKEVGLRRVLVLGGWPRRLADLRKTLDDPAIELLCRDGGSGLRSVATVESDLAWADVLVVWRRTPLDHSFSGRYTGRAREGKFRTRSFTVDGGVQAFCQELERHALGRRLEHPATAPL